MKVISHNKLQPVSGGVIATTTVLATGAAALAGVGTAALATMTGGLFVIGAGVATYLGLKKQP